MSLFLPLKFIFLPYCEGRGERGRVLLIPNSFNTISTYQNTLINKQRMLNGMIYGMLYGML
jgi:hypothetical protein